VERKYGLLAGGLLRGYSGAVHRFLAVVDGLSTGSLGASQANELMRVLNPGADSVWNTEALFAFHRLAGFHPDLTSDKPALADSLFIKIYCKSRGFLYFSFNFFKYTPLTVCGSPTTRFPFIEVIPPVLQLLESVRFPSELWRSKRHFYIHLAFIGTLDFAIWSMNAGIECNAS
jgi:hypothetical protein